MNEKTEVSEKQLNVFDMDDYTWYIGYDLESCKAAFLKACDYDEDVAEVIESARPLTQNELDKIQYTPDCGTTYHSFREQMNVEALAGGEFPRFFATTEW